MDEAVELNNLLIELNRKVSGSYGVAGVKYAMDVAGFAGGNPRMPLPPLDAEAKRKIYDDIRASGLVPADGRINP